MKLIPKYQYSGVIEQDAIKNYKPTVKFPIAKRNPIIYPSPTYISSAAPENLQNIYNKEGEAQQYVNNDKYWQNRTMNMINKGLELSSYVGLADLPIVATKEIAKLAVKKGIQKAVKNKVVSLGRATSDYVRWLPVPNRTYLYDEVGSLQPPSFLSRFNKKIPMLEDSMVKGLGDAKNFFEQDVIPRYRKILANPNDADKILKTASYPDIKTKNILNEPAHFSTVSGDIHIKKDNITPHDAGSLITHELTHSNSYYMPNEIAADNNMIYGVSPQEKKALNEAYSYLVDKEKGINDLKRLGLDKSIPELLLEEKHAANRQLRFNISNDNNNVYGEDLDKIIDNLSNDEIDNYLKHTNGYTQSFYRFNRTIKENSSNQAIRDMYNKIKYAIKTVPSISGATYIYNKKADH